jgi:Rieske Fe-S protein
MIMLRKGSVNFLIIVVLCLLPSLLGSCSKSTTTGYTDPSEDFTIDISKPPYGALIISGGYYIVNNVVIINSGNVFSAVSDLCTYDGCALKYSSSALLFTCPCDGGTFSENGTLLSGPSSTSLKVYTVTQNSSVLHIQG